MTYLICAVGDNVTLTRRTNMSVDINRTADISVDITEFSVGCEVHLHTPGTTFTWIKDGIVVVRDASKGGNASIVIDDAFLTLGNNALLFMISPLPLTINFELKLSVDLRATNTSANRTLPEELREKNLLEFILGIIEGNWTCSARNRLGTDSKSTIIRGQRSI